MSAGKESELREHQALLWKAQFYFGQPNRREPSWTTAPVTGACILEPPSSPVCAIGDCLPGLVLLLTDTEH